MSGLEEKAEERRRRIKQEKEDDDESQEDASSDSDSEEEKMVTAMLKQRCALRSKLPVLDLKSYRNTVPVPKVDVECSERVIEKPPYKLPSYIAATGIEKAREASTNIDYEVLYDAFFKHQTKPRLTKFGDLYYEGKEFDQVERMDQIKPGRILSHELKEALGMSEGVPPPWLINMQRYGPPPSFPHLKIPGLNAPVPGGASFGYHPIRVAGGSLLLMNMANPLYGDVFGVEESKHEEEAVAKMKHWGELEAEEEEEEEKDVEDDVESLDSVSIGGADETVPDKIELRKQQTIETDESRPLYQVLEQKEERIAAGTLLGTTHSYVVGSSRDDKAGVKRVDLFGGHKADKVEVTLQPEELEAMQNVLPERYQQAREEERLRNQPEDCSDMVVENIKKTMKKRKMQEKDAKSDKKYMFF